MAEKDILKLYGKILTYRPDRSCKALHSLQMYQDLATKNIETRLDSVQIFQLI